MQDPTTTVCKGSYIVRIDHSGSQLQTVGDWIVPDLPPVDPQ